MGDVFVGRRSSAFKRKFPRGFSLGMMLANRTFHWLFPFADRDSMSFGYLLYSSGHELNIYHTIIPWNIGMLECWNLGEKNLRPGWHHRKMQTGVLAKLQATECSTGHFVLTPIFHHSKIPSFQDTVGSLCIYQHVGQC